MTVEDIRKISPLNFKTGCRIPQRLRNLIISCLLRHQVDQQCFFLTITSIFCTSSLFYFQLKILEGAGGSGDPKSTCHAYQSKWSCSHSWIHFLLWGNELTLHSVRNLKRCFPNLSHSTPGQGHSLQAAPKKGRRLSKILM